MSVIFDALNKLDREKRTPQTGMLIVGAGGITKRRGVNLPALTATLFAVASLAAAWWWTNDGQADPEATLATPQAAPGAQPDSQAARVTRPPPGAVAQPGDLAVVPEARPPASEAPVVDPRSAAAASPGASAAARQPSDPAQLRLEAITQRNGSPVAILSGRLVREGDAFDGIKVVRIGEAEVELLVEVEGRSLVLTF